MTMKEKNLDYWRNYFERINSSIFEIIDNAIMVAATDHPKEFMIQRGQIAEKLYWNRCDHNLNEECDDLKIGRDVHAEMKMGQVSKYSYSQAEALTDEIDEDNEIFGEVIRIKEILDNCQYEVWSNSVFGVY